MSDKELVMGRQGAKEMDLTVGNPFLVDSEIRYSCNHRESIPAILYSR